MSIIKVDTMYGKYIGKKSEWGVIAFKGIPYAKPPVKELRWKAPVRQEKSELQYEAFEFGFSCIQPVDQVELASVRTQSEDCLTLNIWTRSITDVNMPVMVFIHGGGYIGGGSSDPVYDGESFPKRNDVVFVTINYRCNVLGYMDLEEIGGPEYKDSKNLGVLDQVAALEWVRENIALFGGNPENITIVGESAGSGSVSLLMTVPMAKGLFRKVIAESGGLNMHKSQIKAKEITKDFIRHAGTKSMTELLGLTENEIRDTCNSLMAEYGYVSEIMFAPVADGIVIPKDPFGAIAAGCAAEISLLVGTTAEELNYWRCYYDDFGSKIKEFLAAQTSLIGPDLDSHSKTIEAYLGMKPERTQAQGYLDLSVELLFRIPSIKIAEIQSRFTDTFMYQFTWQSSLPGMGACHAVELPFVFNNLDSESGITFTGANPPPILADQVQDAWVAFAETGNPSHHGIPEWFKYEEQNRKTMMIDNEWAIMGDPGQMERLLLKNMFGRA